MTWLWESAEEALKSFELLMNSYSCGTSIVCLMNERDSLDSGSVSRLDVEPHSSTVALDFELVGQVQAGLVGRLDLDGAEVDVCGEVGPGCKMEVKRVTGGESPAEVCTYNPRVVCRACKRTKSVNLLCVRAAMWAAAIAIAERVTRHLPARSLPGAGWKLVDPAGGISRRMLVPWIKFVVAREPPWSPDLLSVIVQPAGAGSTTV